MFLEGQTTEFLTYEYLPFLPIAPFIQYSFQLSDCLLILQATPFTDEACGTNNLLGETESCWKTQKTLIPTPNNALLATWTCMEGLKEEEGRLMYRVKAHGIVHVALN